jgi:hypothetical protein
MAKKPIAVEKSEMELALSAVMPTSEQVNLVLGYAATFKVAAVTVVGRYIAGLDDAGRELKLGAHRTSLRTVNGKLLSLAELKTADVVAYAKYQQLTTATATLKREREGTVVRTPSVATGVSVFSVATLKSVLDMYLPKCKMKDWPNGAEFSAWIEAGITLCNKK